MLNVPLYFGIKCQTETEQSLEHAYDLGFQLVFLYGPLPRRRLLMFTFQVVSGRKFIHRERRGYLESGRREGEG